MSMTEEAFSRTLDLKSVRITDTFWGREQELVRTEVIPYQWEALNDRIPDAAPSYCMRNFKVAGRLMREKKEQGSRFIAPAYSFRGFQALPEDPANPDPDKFYGFVFQDSDFAKWIEAVAYSLTNHPDAALEKVADEAIDIVCAAQAENGYLDTYYIINGMDRIFTNLRDHHELYCFGHLAEGAIAYYQATGKEKLLGAVKRYADFLCMKFGEEEGKCKGYPGHEIAEMALARLYELTGEKKYLELGSFFLDMRGRRPYYFDLEEAERAEHEDRPYRQPGEELRFQYHQAHLPVREQSEAVGHAVRAVYLYSGMADVARLTGDAALVQACGRLWNSIVREKLYITGGIGGTHVGEAFSFPYDLPNDTAYSETCAAIGLAFFARRMLQLQVDSQYGDVMEQALYNTVLAGMALDGKSFFYVNPLEVLPEACRRDERKRHVKPVRQKWFGCACCPPNIARTVSSLGAYIYTQNRNTLYTHLYVGSDIWVDLGGKRVNIVMDSEFPWEGRVKVLFRHVGDDGTAVDTSEEQTAAVPEDMSEEQTAALVPEDMSEEQTAAASENAFEEPAVMAFRMPGWCKRAEIEVRRRCRTGVGQEEVKCTLAGWSVDRKESGACSAASAAEMIKDAEGSVFDMVMQETAEQAADMQQMKNVGQAAGLQLRVEKGYLYLTGSWQEGDEIYLNFPMDVRCVSADTRVRENIGKAAITRGPIVYCLEEADNGAELGLLRVNMEKLQKDCAAKEQETGQQGVSGGGGVVEKSTALGHEMRILKIPGFRQEAVEYGNVLYGESTPESEREVILTFLPYYAWNNRGEGEMSVWVRR